MYKRTRLYLTISFHFFGILFIFDNVEDIAESVHSTVSKKKNYVKAVSTKGKKLHCDINININVPGFIILYLYFFLKIENEKNKYK